MANLILSINPGSTSTKIGVFNNLEEFISTSIDHDAEELKEFSRVIDQLDLRLKYILQFLKEKAIKFEELKAVVGRGGTLKPIPGGTYEVNDKMLEDLKAGLQGEHASNLGGLLARAISIKANCPAFIVDPVVVDELQPLARLTGLPEFKKRSIFHALNQRAVARKYAAENKKKYDEITAIVAHLGGGISVGLHHQGKIIDVNNALSGDGPFSPNRSGGLPTYDLFQLCYSGQYTEEEIREKLLYKGGVIAYLGTNDMREVERRIARGDEKAKLVFETMAYQVGKEIGSLATVVKGKVDAVILTGGIAYSRKLTELIEDMVQFISAVKIYPGEEELLSLAAGAYRVLSGEEEAKLYN